MIYSNSTPTGQIDGFARVLDYSTNRDVCSDLSAKVRMAWALIKFESSMGHNMRRTQSNPNAPWQGMVRKVKPMGWTGPKSRRGSR